MSAAHTPGPWYWDSDKYDQGRTRFQVVARGRTIAKTYYPDYDGQAKADTVLMAASPDLLAAAVSAEDFMTEFDDGNLHDDVRGILLALRAAIAKALPVTTKDAA
jgi:hypothetical protein